MIIKEIMKQSKSHNINTSILNEDNYKSLINKIKFNYIKESYAGNYFWQSLKVYSVMQDDNGWKYIKEFIKDSECILFFDEIDEKKAISFESGYDLVKLLGETWGFVFYVTDIMNHYLICFNDHDCLFGCGSALEWVENLKV